MDNPRSSGFKPSAIYSDVWVRKNFCKNNSRDLPKYDQSIVVNRSWCRTKSEGSVGEPQSSKQPSLSSFLLSMQRTFSDNNR